MKHLSASWKSLTRDQRAAWNVWAKNHPMILDTGATRRLPASKAFTRVLSLRAASGAAENPTVLPTTPTWLSGALSARDTGPFTHPPGSACFRVEVALSSATKWFVWATPPVLATEQNPLPLLRFVTCLSLGVLAQNAITPSFATAYRSVLGSFDGPGVEGQWDPYHYVWFRVHQYLDGQLGPASIFKGFIEVEL